MAGIDGLPYGSNSRSSKIEEKCKINFGEVKVKDNKEWLPDLLYGSAPMLALKYAWKQGRTPTKMDYNLSFITSSFAEILFFPPI